VRIVQDIMTLMIHDLCLPNMDIMSFRLVGVGDSYSNLRF